MPVIPHLNTANTVPQMMGKVNDVIDYLDQFENQNDAHEITFAPAVGIAANNVQDAIVETKLIANSSLNVAINAVDGRINANVAMLTTYINSNVATLNSNINANTSALTTRIDGIEETVSNFDMDAIVPKTGGTFTGTVVFPSVQVNGTWPTLLLRKNASGEANQIIGQNPSGIARWGIVPGAQETETGSNAGSNFAISRYADNGVWIDNPITINRASGQASFISRPSWAGHIPWDSGNFTPSSKMDIAGGTFTGNVVIQGNWPALGLKDTDSGLLRYVLGDAGLMGFTDTAGAHTFTVNDSGDLYSKKYGDLATYITNRAWTVSDERAASHAALRVAKTGDSMTGTLTIANTYPALGLHDTDEGFTRFIVSNAGAMTLTGPNAGYDTFRVYDSGAVWTAQVGDLSTYIENRAVAHASGKVAKTGDTMTGSLWMSSTWPTINFYWAGVKHTSFHMGSNGAINLQDGAGQLHQAFSSNGNIWTQSYGNLHDYIWTTANERGSAHAGGLDYVHRIRFTGYGESAVAGKVWDHPIVVCDAFWNGTGVTRCVRTLQFHAPKLGGYVNAILE